MKMHHFMNMKWHILQRFSAFVFFVLCFILWCKSMALHINSRLALWLLNFDIKPLPPQLMAATLRAINISINLLYMHFISLCVFFPFFNTLPQILWILHPLYFASSSKSIMALMIWLNFWPIIENCSKELWTPLLR